MYLLDQWKSQMLTKGQRVCDYLDQPHTQDEYLAATYYDGAQVLYQIAQLTGDSKWSQYATRMCGIYRDSYVIPNNGAVAGYWNFSDGLLTNLQSGEAKSKDAINLLATNAAFSGESTPAEWTAGAETQREVAYAIITYLNAEIAGLGSRARLQLLVDQALSHLDQLYISKTYRCPSTQFGPVEAVVKYHIKPFMTGLEIRALIRYYEKTKAVRILPAVRASIDWLWANAWVRVDQSFWYENWADDPSGTFTNQPGAPDLNLLLAPAFAWMYAMTGESKYLEQGDQVFNGGVVGAFLDNPKQFNQNYLWSFDYVKWRSGAVAQPAPQPVPLPQPTPQPTPQPLPAPCTISAPPSITIPRNGSGDINITLSNLTEPATITVIGSDGQVIVSPLSKVASPTSAVLAFKVRVKKQGRVITFQSPCGSVQVRVNVN